MLCGMEGAVLGCMTRTGLSVCHSILGVGKLIGIVVHEAVLVDASLGRKGLIAICIPWYTRLAGLLWDGADGGLDCLCITLHKAVLFFTVWW
jgi:hypothetical protein